MTLTLANLPHDVDRALRQRAAAEGKAVDQVAIEALKTGLGVAAAPIKQRDLSDVAGTWVEDPDFDRAIAEHDQVSPDDWR